jgi:hypothetical protein
LLLQQFFARLGTASFALTSRCGLGSLIGINQLVATEVSIGTDDQFAIVLHSNLSQTFRVFNNWLSFFVALSGSTLIQSAARVKHVLDERLSFLALPNEVEIQRLDGSARLAGGTGPRHRSLGWWQVLFAGLKHF